MKRTHDTEPAHGDNPGQAKRPKALQACTACRRAKVRCESIDGGPVTLPSITRCRRCKNINQPCSFENAIPGSPTAPDNHSSVILHANGGRTTSRSPPSIHSPVTVISSEHSAGPATRRLEDAISDDPGHMEVPWGMLRVGGLDCLATPVLALHTAMQTNQSDGALPGESLAAILSEARIAQLTNLFQSRYHPWLNLHDHHDLQDPLLILAQCAVAARHVDTDTESRLREAAETATLSQIFNPAPSTASIQALLILAMWPSLCDVSSNGAKDNRLLMASGVSMAKNIQIDQSSARLAALREGGRLDGWTAGSVASGHPEIADQGRLWLCLTNAESLLCLGTGRKPTSHRTASDHRVVSASSFSTLQQVRDTRLGIMGELFDVTERGINLRLAGSSEFDRWYKEVLDVLANLNQLNRLVAPLRVVAKHETFYCHALHIIYLSCRLMVLQHVLNSARLNKRSHDGKPWYENTVHGGIHFAKCWGQDGIITAEAVLISACTLSDHNLLSTAPDSLFALITCAAAFVLMAKSTMIRLCNVLFQSASDSLLTSVVEHMSAAALSSEHFPAKCARLIMAWVKKWEQNVNASGPSTHFKDVPESHGYDAGPVNASQSDPDVVPNNDDFVRFMGLDVYLDTGFWTSFMENISIPNS